MQNPRYAEDISVDTSNKSKLRKLLEDNPIEALTSGPSSLAFKYQTDSFGLATTPPSNLIPVLTDLLAEIVDWRLAEYLSRLCFW